MRGTPFTSAECRRSVGRIPRGLVAGTSIARFCINICDIIFRTTMQKKRILIVGGGFGGVKAALSLAEERLPDTKVVLVSDKPHFEYTPALYRVVTGSSPLEVCIPLREIFEGTNVEVVEDTIIEANPVEQVLLGSSGSRYAYDFCVLALGSETNYFGIPGLEKLSYGFKSITETLHLKRHLHEMFEACAKGTKEEKVCSAHIIVIGGGATGVELAGVLTAYAKRTSKMHGLDPSLVTVDLIEASPRLLPNMPEAVSNRVKERLHALGVNIFLNRTLIKNEVEEVFMKDMQLKTKTVVWAAGVKPSSFYAKVKGLVLDKRGRAEVSEQLEAKGVKNLFVIGDAASLPFSGMAQTASWDAEYAAKCIAARVRGEEMPKPYVQRAPYHAVPVGPKWAVVLLGKFAIYGRVGWWMRRAADLRYFFSILPIGKALHVFRDGKILSESCPTCLALLKETQEEFK